LDGRDGSAYCVYATTQRSDQQLQRLLYLHSVQQLQQHQEQAAGSSNLLEVSTWLQSQKQTWQMLLLLHSWA
jgi:hypothetical protein